MNSDLAYELAALGQLTVSGLRARYAELFDDETRVGNRERWTGPRKASPRPGALFRKKP